MIAPFVAAAECGAAIVASDRVAASWREPSVLAGYTVGALAGHLLGATARLEWALDQDPPQVAELLDVASFYGLNRIEAGDIDAGAHPFIRDDGATRAEAGPDGVAEQLSSLVERLADRLPEEPMDRPVPVLNVKGGATSLATYLRTRVVELIVHADDLAAGAGLALELPPAAVDVAVGVFVELARARSGDVAVVRAFTRAERAAPETLRVL